MGYVKLSPSIILRSLPVTRAVWILSLSAFAIFNCLEITLPIYDQDLFSRWLAFSRPLVDFASNHMWAIGHVAWEMQHDGYGNMLVILSNKVDTVLTFIALDWAIYLVALAGLLLAVLLDFAIAARRISAEMEKRLFSLPEKVDNWGSGTRLENIIFIYLIFSTFSVAYAYTGLSYDSPIRLYDSDVGMILVLVFWYGALCFPPSLLLLILLRFYGGRWIGMNRANT